MKTYEGKPIPITERLTVSEESLVTVNVWTRLIMENLAPSRLENW